MALRKDRFFAHIDERNLAAAAEHAAQIGRTHQDCHDEAAAKSRRLLRRHAFDFAGLEIEAHAMDLIEIGPGHADET
jgi:hypothetical protein